MGGGTEAFPELGAHCHLVDCHQLDFLPFNCDRCHKTFCLEHRTYGSHECPKPNLNSRKVVVCEICSTSIETTGKFGEDEKAIVEKHLKSEDCDASKKNKPRCPVTRCKERLTFSNNAVCRSCNIKVCLKHRFPAEHACKRGNTPAAESGDGGLSNKFVAAFGLRNGNDCATSSRKPGSPTSNSRSVRAC